jgi:hypothetical protein
MSDWLQAIHDTMTDSKAKAIAIYAKVQGIQEEEVEAALSHYDMDNQTIEWLCYKRGSFVRWPSTAFPLEPWMPANFMLDGGVLDLGLREEPT